MAKKVWMVIPIVVFLLVRFPAGAQDDNEPIEVPAMAVDGMATMHQYFPAGDWDYSFSPGQSDDVVLTALSSEPHGVVRWVRFPAIEYDLEEIQETINEAWMDGILINYNNTEISGRCVIDDSLLFIDITGFDGNERPYAIHYWVWVDDTGWNDLFIGIAPEATEILEEFEEGHLEVVGACEEEEEEFDAEEADQ
ncbi:MAG: hypothetical protein L0154_23740 [Chloroflexi bacterium]|nr:hypothetical protein [Chloroflexota bacterium]